MSLFKPRLDTPEISIPEHPWAHRIKEVFSNRYKHAHNSIRNPTYTAQTNKNESIPKKPKKKFLLDSKRIKFTVIGDRVSKEFIYCVNLVKELYKYKKKTYECPEIRGVLTGVTTLEWPSIWNDLKLRLGGLAFCLTSSVAVLINDKVFGGEKELKEFVETHYNYYLSLDYYKEAVAEFRKYINSYGRPCAFMNVSIDKEHIGTMIFMLYSEIVPYTCDNFLRLCKETKGGYSGTPIHRIVKDGWIQGGGWGLKSTSLSCENFIVPFDRRGVLAMANAGRGIDCSTQFFVLLQPAQWMANKFVAFGQLIEGKGTLEKIEAVPTWYESPTSEIIITKAGVFNMECRDSVINKGAREYLAGHIENLNDLKGLMWENILEKVFLTIEMREVERLREVGGERAEHSEGAGGIRETQRFNRKKEDIKKQLETSESDNTRATPVSRAPSDRHTPPSNTRENNDFDVESYDPEYEAEETDDLQQSWRGTASPIVKPDKPYYLALTDVPYPGEKDSNFDLKRFLQGDYCLESDLKQESIGDGKDAEHITLKKIAPGSSDIDSPDDHGDEDDAEYGTEINKYMQANVDQVSFAGGIVKNIAKGREKITAFEDKRKTDLITDENLRKLRIASVDQRQHPRQDKVAPSDSKEECHSDKKVLLEPEVEEHHSHIKRRQTGFIRPQDLAEILKMSSQMINEDDDDDDDDDDEDDNETNRPRQVSIELPDDTDQKPQKITRRQTGFVRPKDLQRLRKIDSDEDDDDDDRKFGVGKITTSTDSKWAARRTPKFTKGTLTIDDEEEQEEHKRQSVLVRLFDDIVHDEEPPTLKDYKPASEHQPKNVMLTISSNFAIKSDESIREKYVRYTMAGDKSSVDHVLTLQHGKKVTRKISSDYVKTIDQIEHRLERSIRAFEFAKKRPAMSIARYQEMNRKYQDQLKLDGGGMTTGKSTPYGNDGGA